MGHESSMQRHMEQMAAMRRRMLWVHYLVIALGAWLATSPFLFGLFDAQAALAVRDITAERQLWPAELPAARQLG